MRVRWTTDAEDDLERICDSRYRQLISGSLALYWSTNSKSVIPKVRRLATRSVSRTTARSQ